MADRIKFIVNTSVSFFNATQSEDDSIIKEFFENDDITILAATKSDTNKIHFHHKIPTEENLCLLFYKVPQAGTNQSNGNCNNQSGLGLLTLEGGMVKSIYNSVTRVFSPHGTRRSEYSSELSGLLENLHVSLGSTLGLPQTGINNIQDEIKFWNRKSTNSSIKSDREQAKLFATSLEKIHNQLRQIDQNSLSTVEEFLDSAHNNLDELWRLPYHYPQNRMADLMDVICNQIIEISIENVQSEDVWNLNSYHINNLINQIIDIIDSWLQICDSLTRLFWPNYGQHSWIGKPHIPNKGKLFKERLHEIKDIKKLYKQISTLLNGQDLRNVFTWNAPFTNINIFDLSSIGQSKWNKALNQFEQFLQPIDEKIALAIKSQLYNHLSNPRQVIYIFSKYDTLIQRPTVLELLTIEREQFLQSLHILLQDLRKAMNDTNMEPDTGYLSTICNECRWLKVVQYQIYEIEKVIHLVNGREGFEEVNKSLQNLKEETETLLKTNFEIWTEQSLSAIKSGDLKLREDQPVVEFEKDGRQLMRVTFNPKLVTFCQDVREFENLGYRVPIELRSSANHALKFMSYARRLQQIATFHNTIGDRMIPCQRPIMLRNAIELSKLVQSESVAWNDEESVQRYVTTLQDAVAKLSADNNLLVGYHEQAKRTVVKLMNTDLLTQGQIWKDEMRHLRELVATLESQGYINLDAFKLHWDHQLYKVLEYQYISGLIDMNNKLPDIHIDIVFRQQQLQFRPSEEEIRSRYFTQLRRFIERPLGFRGLSEKSNDLFKIMVERNRHYFGPLYKRAEELFQKLNELKNLWIPWVALGCVDIDELCSIHLTKWQHWDTNFKVCKYFGQQIAKIQNSEETVDCFIINILPLRTDIEFISRRFWEALANSLRTSILNDIAVIQEFLQISFQFLHNISIDESEIVESGIKYEKLKSELPKISQIIEEVKGKDTCLGGWCKERVSILSDIITQWEKLQPLIDNHSVVLQRQVDIMKNHLTTQAENLQNEAEKFLLRWESTITELESNNNNNNNSNHNQNTRTDLTLFKERQETWKQIKERFQKFSNDANKLNTQIPEDIIRIIEEIENKITKQSKQWEIYDKFSKELIETLNEEWTVYRRRPYIFTEFLSKWEQEVKTSTDTASSRIRQTIDQYQKVLPILQHLQSDSLTEKHWTRLFQLLNKNLKPLHLITLNDVVEDMNLLQKHSNEIQSLVRQASSEQIVRQALNELDQWTVTAVLKLTKHTDSSGTTISLVRDFEEILNKIGDNQSLLQSAKNSAAFDAFSDQAEIWEARLNTLDTILTSLSRSQRKWVYLEPIFGAGTLKNEEALFKRIDKDFRYILREIENDPRVLSVIKINNIINIINSLENQLSRCQQTLMSYIMEKRDSFPRFYFLGDDDLLEILGQAHREEIIQKHIKKLFPGVHRLVIQKSSLNEINVIQKIQSFENDSVTLVNPVEMKGSIENWLNELVVSIQVTIKDQIIQCHTDLLSLKSSQLTHDFIVKYPIQVLCTVLNINFTKQIEKAITSMSLTTILKTFKNDIFKLTEMKNSTTIQDDHLLQLKLRGILLDFVHYITVVEYLIEKNVTTLDDWHWLQQMKFYLNNNNHYQQLQQKQQQQQRHHQQQHKINGHVTIKMVFAEFDYSYEFLGNPNKLVHTTLTHKCYLTLTQAMHMGLGGNPFGPAGTGKTECVKALGGMMGRLVLVFNCDENVDTEAMGLILAGLAKCGAWGCFDEFNRLQEATLSAISMLIQPIQGALKDKCENVQILDKTIKLNHHCGIFVTLNPAGEEYRGRQQLPGNIQALFRPIVMQQPKSKEIARIMLFVEGFQYANEIGDRIVEIFDLSSKILSSQKHYDWGLRELKTILLACGEQLREIHSNKDNIKIINNVDDEMKIVVQTLCTNTMSKLNTDDSQKFDMLLKNVFPEIQIGIESNLKLQSFIEDAFSAFGLCVNNRQIEKCLQLHEQLIKRMGVVIVGPSSSGKTSIISLLKHALNASGKIIHSYTINPKCMNRIQLLGKLDTDTRQWTDGVLTSTAIQVNSEPENINSWIICDGDIDPEWIEALNSVLDDNKLLTLPSGWRIQFGNNVNFIFETHDLSYASPATISRLGIINISSEDLKDNVIIEAYLKNTTDADLLQSYIEQYLNFAVDWIHKELIIFSNISKICIFKAILQNILKCKNKDEFCTNLIQSAIGFILIEKQNQFANKILELMNIYISNPSKAEYCYFNNVRDVIEVYDDGGITTPQPLPSTMMKNRIERNERNIFSVEINEVSIHQYEQQNQQQKHDSMTDTSTQLILTGQIKFYLNMLHKFFTSPLNSPFIVIGPPGSGKTLLIQSAISQLNGYQLVTLKCSTQLTPNYILYFLKQNCITISGVKGREYKPQKSKLILFLKNIDLCLVDSWGTSNVVELLRQLIQRGGFHSPDNLEWIHVNDLQICATMSSETKQKLSSRYLSINNYLNIKLPTENNMKIILRTSLQSILSRFKNISSNSSTIVESLIDFFQRIQDSFCTQTQIHYNFTPKLITSTIERLQYYPEEYFNEALLTELNLIFKNRLITEEDIMEYERIIRDTIRIAKNEMYFIPKSQQTSIMKYVTPEEWKDTVRKLTDICNSELLLIDNPITVELLHLTAALINHLSRSGSHILLIGRPGCQQIESVYLASVFGSSKIFIPQGIRKYSLTDFYSDLKLAMQSAALENQSTIFLIDHCWLVYLPDIMKPIEAILQGSEIIDLFGDDLESIASPLKNAAQLEGYQESLTSYFYKRVQENLHLILNLDSTVKNFDELLNVYSSLYRCTEIICILPPSEKTTSILPKQIISSLSEEKDSIPVPSYFTILTEIKNQEAPQKFVWLIKSYTAIYIAFKDKTMKQLQKLRHGVEKLADAHKIVATLKDNAIQQEEALANKRKLANEALTMISTTMRSANDQKTDLLELKKETQANSEKLKIRKKAIELELQEVEPKLREASAAVGQIKSEALSEIRSLRAPPEIIRDILEGVIRLMGIRDTSWNSMKSFLAKRGVKEDIRSLDPSRISPENCEAVEKLLQTKSDSFDIRNAKRASIAAAPLATWVIANVKYAKVMQSIKPLEIEQNELERNLEMAENQIKSLTTGLDSVDARVKELSRQLNVYTQEAAVLELKLEEARNTLQSSEVLVEKLSTEFHNWNKQTEDYNQTIETLDTKSFLIALILSYYTNYQYEKRKSFIDSLVQKLHLSEFNVTRSLITEQDEIIWESMGLSKGTQTIENAAILLKFIEIPFEYCATPIVIDPSGTAISWLKEYLQNIRKPFDVISQNSDKLSYTLELGIRFGKILIITDCHDLQPPVLQVLFKRITCKFNKKLIQVGNKLVDLHDDFRLILFSKLKKLEINSELHSYLAKISFTVNIISLTDQLISKTISLKKPELEEKRIMLLKNEGNLLQQRIKLEDRLLEELSNAQGNILKNEKLLQTLNEVKQSSAQIDDSLMKSAEIKESLVNEFKQFSHLCSMSSKLYMNLSLMYTISIQAFTNIFMKILKKFDNFDEKRIYSELVRNTYQYLCRSTPKNDHITLGMYLCKSAFPELISTTEWELFVTNFMTGDDTLGLPCPSWIKKELIPKILVLRSHLPEMYKCLQLENEDLWRSYVKSAEMNEKIPVKLSPFQKVLISQIFRPDYMSITMVEMISTMIDIKTTSISQPSLEVLAEESSKDIPLLIITESGIDPSNDIKILSNKIVGKQMYIEFSIGKGMEKLALSNVKKALEQGKWICIKNVHLTPNWLTQVFQELETNTTNGSDNFRLWIICDSAKDFPEAIINKCIKVLFEFPNGLKNKIRYLMQQWNPLLSTLQNKDVKIIKLYIVSLILNSVLLERRKFIPQGWTKWYDFGESDLQSALKLLSWMENYMKSSRNQISWLVLQGLYDCLAYGGRINNERDFQIFTKHLKEFFNENVLTGKWQPLGLKIVIPTTKNLQEYYDAIYKLPDIDMPENFGLSPLSNVSRNISLCKEVVKTLRSAFFQDNEQNSVEKRIRPILSLWKKLSPSTTILKTYNNLPEIAKNEINIWQSFLISEIRIGGQLFKEIHENLVHLHVLQKNSKSCTPNDREMLNCLSENKVPISWRKIWPGPQTVIEYIRNFIYKNIQIEKYYQNYFDMDFIDSIDLANVFNPQGFLSGLKIVIAKKLNKSPIDLELSSCLSPISDATTVKISPLMVDGGSFKNNQLVIFDQNDMKYSPEFYLTFTHKQLKSDKIQQPTATQNLVEIPVYSNIHRDNLICFLSIPCQENFDDVLLSGAAFVIPMITTI